MDPSFSVLIPDGDSQFALFVAHSFAQKPNVKVHILSSQHWSPIRFSRYCHSYTYVPALADEQTKLKIVADVVKKQKIDVILPTETRWITFAVAHQEALTALAALVPLPQAKSFAIANDKWQLSQFLAESNIPGPPTVLLTDFEGLAKDLQNIQFPILLKPITAWGGDGIERFDTRSDLQYYLEHQDLEKIKNRFIVQSFLPGTVVGVNILARQGELLACTMQKGVIPNTHKFAAAGGIRFLKESRFLEIAQDLVAALNWSGFANIDTLHDSQDDQLKILEINARFWGSLRGSLVAGVNFPYLACLAALDIPFALPEYELSYYIHPKTALREGIAKFFGKRSGVEYTFSETGFKFLMVDPLAELFRAFQQQVLTEEAAIVLDEPS